MLSIMQWVLNPRKHIRNCKKTLHREREKKRRKEITARDVKIFIFLFNVAKILKIVKGDIGNEGLMMKKVSIIFVFDVQNLIAIFPAGSNYICLFILSRQEGNVLPKHTNEHAKTSLTMKYRTCVRGLALKHLVDSILIVEKHEIYKSSA